MCKIKSFLGGKIMGTVITSDGIRMTYIEWLEMVKAEQI